MITDNRNPLSVQVISVFTPGESIDPSTGPTTLMLIGVGVLEVSMGEPRGVVSMLILSPTVLLVLKFLSSAADTERISTAAHVFTTFDEGVTVADGRCVWGSAIANANPTKTATTQAVTVPSLASFITSLVITSYSIDLKWGQSRQL